jgi:hypothetical protein
MHRAASVGLRHSSCLPARRFPVACSPSPPSRPNPTRAVARFAAIRSEAELQRIAVVDRKVMVGMRDGLRMQADIYRPKGASSKVPAIFVRTPYNFNWWDVRLGAPSDMTSQPRP